MGLAGRAILTVIVFFISLAGISPNFIDGGLLFFKDKISLGLDLKGGSALTMRVDFHGYFLNKLDSLLVDTKSYARTHDIKLADSELVNDKLSIALVKDSDYNMLSAFIKSIDKNIKVEINDKHLEAYYQNSYINDAKVSLIVESIANIRRRIDAVGNKEISIQKFGDDMIILQVPGVYDSEHIRRLIGKTAHLSFHMLKDEANKNAPIMTLRDAAGNTYQVLRNSELGGEAIKSVAPFSNSIGKATVSFRFDAYGSNKFAKLTKENVGKFLAIVLDEQVIAVPVITEPIVTGAGEISGNFSSEEANELAIMLRSGALPTKLEVVEEKTIGPSLGAEAIHDGQISAIFSMFTVMLSMIIIYRTLGLLASIALVFNLVTLLFMFTLFGTTLTLPGIAGIALTMGMAVDANVLIFERLREEIKAGRKMTSAIRNSFKQAMTTILDSNITTIIAGSMMFFVGSGSIRGFAVTLISGILCSMFSSIFVTQMLIDGLMYCFGSTVIKI